MGAVSAAPIAQLPEAEPRNRGGQLRTTLVLPESVDRNVEVFSVTRGISKNAAMLILISDGLRGMGFRPEQTPEIQIHYRQAE
jgi:hypothetical protein